MSVPVSTLKKVGYLSFGASTFFLVESAYEMYVLTALHGPQMLGFSLIHRSPLAVVVLFIGSYFAFYVYLLYAAIISLWGMLPRFKEHRQFINLVRGSLVALSAHLLLLMTYEDWTRGLYGS